MTKDESTRLSRKLGEVHNELIETNVTHTISKQELEGQLKSTTANLRAAEINLVRLRLLARTAMHRSTFGSNLAFVVKTS